MKDFLRIQLFFALLFVVSCTGSSKYMAKTTPTPTAVRTAPADKALVYFMRPSGFGFGIHFQIWDSYRLIGLSQAKCYFAYECDPGTHLFIGRAENKRAVRADLEPGRTYYIITQVKMGGWKARMEFVPVTRNSEFWDKVLEYENKLTYVTTNEAELAEWVAKRQAHVNKEIGSIIAYLDTPEGKKYIKELKEVDGR